MALSTLIIHRPEILMNEKSTKVTLSEKHTDQNLLGLKSGLKILNLKRISSLAFWSDTHQKRPSKSCLVAYQSTLKIVKE